MEGIEKQKEIKWQNKKKEWRKDKQQKKDRYLEQKKHELLER